MAWEICFRALSTRKRLSAAVRSHRLNVSLSWNLSLKGLRASCHHPLMTEHLVSTGCLCGIADEARRLPPATNVYRVMVTPGVLHLALELRLLVLAK